MIGRWTGLRHVYTSLIPGGRLIFDHFVFDPEAIRRHNAVSLRDEYSEEADSNSSEGDDR